MDTKAEEVVAVVKKNETKKIKTLEKKKVINKETLDVIDTVGDVMEATSEWTLATSNFIKTISNAIKKYDL